MKKSKQYWVQQFKMRLLLLGLFLAILIACIIFKMAVGFAIICLVLCAAEALCVGWAAHQTPKQ